MFPEEQVLELLDPPGPGLGDHLPTAPTGVHGLFPFQEEDRLGTALAPPQVCAGHVPPWHSEQSRALQEAQLVIEARRREYNEERTRSAIGDVTPREFIHNYHNRAQLTQEVTSSALV